MELLVGNFNSRICNELFGLDTLHVHIITTFAFPNSLLKYTISDEDQIQDRFWKNLLLLNT